MSNSNAGNNSQIPPGANMGGLNNSNTNMTQAMQHQIQAMQIQMQQQMAIMQRQQAQIQSQRAQLAASQGSTSGNLQQNMQQNPVPSNAGGGGTMSGMMAPQSSLQHAQGMNSWSHPGSTNAAGNSSSQNNNMNMANLSNEMMHAANAVAGSQTSFGLGGAGGAGNASGSASGVGSGDASSNAMLMQQLQFQQLQQMQQQQQRGGMGNQSGNGSVGGSPGSSLNISGSHGIGATGTGPAHRGNSSTMPGGSMQGQNSGGPNANPMSLRNSNISGAAAAAVQSANAGGTNPAMSLQNMSQLQRQMSSSNARPMSGSNAASSLGMGIQQTNIGGSLGSQPGSHTSLHSMHEGGTMMQNLSRNNGTEVSGQNQQFPMFVSGQGQQGSNANMNANMMQQLQHQQQLLAMQNAHQAAQTQSQQPQGQNQGQQQNRMLQASQQQLGGGGASASNNSNIASLRSSFSAGQTASSSLMTMPVPGGGSALDGANSGSKVSSLSPAGNPSSTNSANVNQLGGMASIGAPLPQSQMHSSSLSQSQMLSLLNQQQQQQHQHQQAPQQGQQQQQQQASLGSGQGPAGQFPFFGQQQGSMNVGSGGVSGMLPPGAAGSSVSSGISQKASGGATGGNATGSSGGGLGDSSQGGNLPDFAGGWQSNADLPDRRRVIVNIVKIIERMRPDANKMANRLPLMAKKLEEHLYRSAATKAEYVDPTTLKKRLQFIAHRLGLARTSSGSSTGSLSISREGSSKTSRTGDGEESTLKASKESGKSGKSRRRSSKGDKSMSSGSRGASPALPASQAQPQQQSLAVQQQLAAAAAAAGLKPTKLTSGSSSSGMGLPGDDSAGSSASSDPSASGSSSQQKLPTTSAAAAAVMKMNLLQNQLAQQQALLQQAAQTGNTQQKTQNEALLHQLQAQQSQLQALMNSYSTNANVQGSKGGSGGSGTNINLISQQQAAELQSMQKQQSLNLNTPQGHLSSQQQALSELQKNMQQAHQQQQSGSMHSSTNASGVGGSGPSVPQLPSMVGMLDGKAQLQTGFTSSAQDQKSTGEKSDADAVAQRQKVIKQQQQRLLLLRHASKCTAGSSCTHKLCPEMTKLWQHIRVCRDKNCSTAHCLSSRCVLHHYRICKLEKNTNNCEVCAPVMQQIKWANGGKKNSGSRKSSSRPSGLLAGKDDEHHEEEVDLMEQLAKEHAIQDAADAVAAASGSGQTSSGGSSTNSTANASLSMQMQMQALLQQQQGQQCSAQSAGGAVSGSSSAGNQTQGKNIGSPASLSGSQQSQAGIQEQVSMQQHQLNSASGPSGGQGTQNAQQPGLSVPLSQHQQQQQQALLQQLQVQQQNFLMQLQRKSMMSQQQGQQGEGSLAQMNFGSSDSTGQPDVSSKMDLLAQPQASDDVSSSGTDKPKKRRNASMTRKRKSVSDVGGKGKRISQGKGKRITKVKKEQDKDHESNSDDLTPLPIPSEMDDDISDTKDTKSTSPSIIVSQSIEKTNSGEIEKGVSESKGSQSCQQSSGVGSEKIDADEDKPVKVESSSSVGIAAEKVRSSEEGDGEGNDSSGSAKNVPSSNAEVAKSDEKSSKQTSKDVSLVSTMPTEAIEKHLESLHDNTHLSPRKIAQKCVPLINKLISDPYGWVFKDPVDPEELGIPDYFDVIANPMDLTLVKSRLENGLYKDLESFEKDTKLVFENCIVYNGEDSDVGDMAKDLLSLFDKEFKLLLKGMKTEQKHQKHKGDICSLCGQSRKQFEPTVLYCNGPCGMQRIRRNATYYADPSKLNHWCVPCYGLLKESDPILLDDGNEVRKKDLQKLKNDALAEEGWVECDECHSWVHQICALFNGRKNKTAASYCCPKCHIKQRVNSACFYPMKSVQAAKDLPHCTMSRALEERLWSTLKRAYAERAVDMKCPLNQIKKAENLFVRVVSNMDKKHVVRDEMFKRYRKKGFPSEFPVRSKCILLFQTIHGVDILLFGMYVYEYDHDCPAPNRRRVYISYLDSVHYFEPREYRTLTYHAILVEYLRFVKERGFHTAHIWSCPPSKGDDYIFYCHPNQQKTPRGDMLVAWYHSMLDKAKEEGIVLKTLTLYEEYFKPEGMTSATGFTADDPTCLPYFEGDYVPGEVENIIKDLNKDEERRKEKESRSSKGRQPVANPTGNKRGTRSNPGELVNVGPDKVMLRLGQTLSNMRENFIVVHLRSRAFAAAVERGDDVSRWLEDDEDVLKDKLRSSGKDASILGERPKKKEISAKEKAADSSLDVAFEVEENRPGQGRTNVEGTSSVDFQDRNKKGRKLIMSTTDKDPPQESEFFDSRQQFLNYCTANHFQFDSLRRAKHTTMMILYHLHNPAAPKFLQQCGACYREITHGIRYHCNKCSNFDLCDECYEPVVTGLWAQRDARFAHDKSHTFTPIDMEATSDTQKSREERAKSIKLHLELLQHCASCPGAPSCSSQNCNRMRGLFTHLKTCKVTYRNGCKICSRFLALLSMHARQCEVRYSEQCPIPYCDPIRERNHRLRQQQQLMDDRRRNAQNELYRAGHAEGSSTA